MRILILIHRYLGISVGLLMIMWCLSGIVMIYEPFPRVDGGLRVRSLNPIDWARFNLPVLGIPNESDHYLRFQIETVAGRPVLRAWPLGGSVVLTDAISGAIISKVGNTQAIDVASGYMARLGRHAEHPQAELVKYDQWTVAGSAADRPLYRIKMGDAAGTEIYVSTRTGMVVQATSRINRLWGWLGAVPHWLYPTVLRSRPKVWSEVVIWASVGGVFLTLFGFVVGVGALKRSARLRGCSPYRGVMFWHHSCGLVFGILSLTWVLSGLLSMNPWGLMESGDVNEPRRQLTGGSMAGDEVRTFLGSLSARGPEGIQAVNSAPLDGHLFGVVTRIDSSRVRYDINATMTPLSDDDIRAAARRVAGTEASWTRLVKEDDYHYSIPGQKATIPVIRVRSSHGDYYYIDSISGTLVDRAGAADRAYRWWHSALHRLDIAPFLRSPLGRTLVVLPLLLGTTVLCGIGCFIALRHVVRMRESDRTP